ncbi:AraC family transcriptional regulator [Micromonospora sp. LAH09]|uniref:helix-turn-helix transcriptional regulator n=1 Tax=Micromonospora cabrerizensis TaxID=2911213 RepID=UPI001EE90480|nr:AraC family transcriptional regulator [Micromonospora cabrerizensis]MCG5469558.1 AraC family transcriptional regulator [Micromonospora cabrerizensis]
MSVDDTLYSGAHWQRFATTDSDEAIDYIRRAYIDVTVRTSNDSDREFGLRTIATELGDVSMSRLSYSTHNRVETAPDGDLNISHAIRGRYALVKDKEEHRLRPGDVFLLLPDDSLGIDFDDVDVFATRLPRALLEEAAGTPDGFSGADLRFESTRPISAELGRHWSATVSYVTHSILSDPILVANPLVTAQARQLLAQTALAVFPNTSLDARLDPGGGVPPRALRRAIAYVDDTADRPVTVAQIAAAAGVHPRALQLAFRRHLGTTPTSYVRTVRLDRAHRDLQNADPSTGVTVTVIAHRWGFTHLGRFSADYRSAYGVSPSQTLRV